MFDSYLWNVVTRGKTSKKSIFQSEPLLSSSERVTYEYYTTALLAQYFSLSSFHPVHIVLLFSGLLFIHWNLKDLIKLSKNKYFNFVNGYIWIYWTLRMLHLQNSEKCNLWGVKTMMKVRTNIGYHWNVNWENKMLVISWDYMQTINYEDKPKKLRTIEEWER